MKNTGLPPHSDQMASIHSTLTRLAHQCIDFNWLNDDTRPITPSTLARLLDIYLNHSKNMTAIQAIERALLEMIQPDLSAAHIHQHQEQELPSQKRPKCSSRFATLCRTTLLTYFRACLLFADSQLSEVSTELIGEIFTSTVVNYFLIISSWSFCLCRYSRILCASAYVGAGEYAWGGHGT